ncbi:MAG: GNAT family N-acetyltransferase [Bacteroidota bacterium]
MTLDDPTYLSLWERSPTRAPFTHPVAVRAFADAFGLAPRVVATEGTALSILEKRRGPLVAASLPPLAPVWRPLLAETPAEAETHARSSPLDGLLARLDAEADQHTLALGGDDLRPYTWAGWTATPRSTYRLALTGDVASGYSSAVRRMIRKEADAVDLVEDGALAPEAVRLMVASYQRQGSDLGLDGQALTRLAVAFVEGGLARVFAAQRSGATEAAVVAADDGQTAFYWIAGSTPGPAMTVLVDHTLRQLAADGIEGFDFCGANTPSIAEFKRRFGPRLAPAPIVRRVTHPVLRVADRLR